MSKLKENNIVNNVIENNRLFSILHDKLCASDHYDTALSSSLKQYANDYFEFHKLSPDQVSKSYLSFIKAYSKDSRKYVKTGKYPLELDPKRVALSRIDYSIILLLSTFLTPHRFRIMQILHGLNVAHNDSLFIGCGPGLELSLVDAAERTIAYDLDLDPFLMHKYAKVDFKEEYFSGKGNKTYDHIFLIELLEHVTDPYSLIQNCNNVLNPGGQIYLTTATHIPQFDHLYKFESDHIEFDEKIKGMNFEIIFDEDIIHEKITSTVEAKNKFYIIKKQH